TIYGSSPDVVSGEMGRCIDNVRAGGGQQLLQLVSQREPTGVRQGAAGGSCFASLLSRRGRRSHSHRPTLVGAASRRDSHKPALPSPTSAKPSNTSVRRLPRPPGERTRAAATL